MRSKVTEREAEVLELLVQGMENRAMAESLNISVNTVRAHLENMMAKLRLQNRVQLAVFWTKYRILEVLDGKQSLTTSSGQAKRAGEVRESLQGEGSVPDSVEG